MFPSPIILLLVGSCIFATSYGYYQEKSSHPKYNDKLWFHKTNCQYCPCSPDYQNKGASKGILFPIDPRNLKRQTKHKCSPFCCKMNASVVNSGIDHKNKCGTKPTNKSNRIVTQHQNGTQFSDWPWHTAILMVNNNKNYFVCSGALIGPKHVLTVAHGINNVKNRVLFARLGEWNTQNMDESLPHADYFIRKITVHPQFNAKLLWNDIAILELATKVKYKPNIMNICLPDRILAVDSTKCVVTGWGKDAYVGGRYSASLKEAPVKLVEFNKCQCQLRKTRLGPAFKLHNSFICAGSDSQSDSCKGDGGGPLTCRANANGLFYLKGLVSWGIGCGQSDVAGVYVNVDKFMPWIINNI